MTTTLEDQYQEIRLAGNIGFWSVILLFALLGVHPFGTTELYDSGRQFLEHINAFWVTIHLLGALAFLAFPVTISVWARNLANPRARVLGQLGLYVAIAGTAVGMIHLIATDTTSFLVFSDTFSAGEGSEAVTVAADLLLRIHASTLTAWSVTYFIATPLVLGLAARADGRFPGWYSILAWVGGALSVAAVAITLSEGQWTTLSEMGLFRPSVTLLGLWVLVTSWWMRRGSLTGAAAS